jgi:hypothetical protein
MQGASNVVPNGGFILLATLSWQRRARHSIYR